MGLRSWARVLKNSFVDIQRNHTLDYAAGLCYYFILSLFPALIALSAALGFVPVHDLLSRILETTPTFIPADSMGIVRGVATDILKSNHQALLSFGLIGTLWSASSGFAAMMDALNVAYDVQETRPFWKTRGLALLMIFVVGGLMLAALAIMVVGPSARELWMRAHLPMVASVWPQLRWTLSTAFIVLAVEVIYLLGPNVRQRLRHTLIGAVLAVVVWLVLSYALGVYFQKYAHLSATYGALGGAIALMIWLYWSFFIVLLGAEINGESMKASGAAAQPKQKRPEEKPAKPGGAERAA